VPFFSTLKARHSGMGRVRRVDVSEMVCHTWRKGYLKPFWEYPCHRAQRGSAAMPPNVRGPSPDNNQKPRTLGSMSALPTLPEGEGGELSEEGEG